MAPHWLDKSAYPFQSKYFDVNGQRLHYIDQGEGETILFVHGTPSWSFEFRNIIKELQDCYRCIAIDHIGFGLSDKPEHYDYSPQHHSKTLQRFVLEKHLEDITLVVHDFGGPIGLNFAINCPQKVKRLVILNSWLWSHKEDCGIIKWGRMLLSPLLMLLYRYWNFSPRILLPNSFGDRKLSSHLIKQYTKPFADKSQRNGVLAFAKSLWKDQGWFEELWNKRQAISNKPTLLIWGVKDPFIKSAYLDKFQSGFTNSTTVKLMTCGHFPQEEQPDLVARELSIFLV